MMSHARGALEVTTEDVVIADQRADGEGADADLAEVVALVEAQGAPVFGVDAEQKATGAAGARCVDGDVHQLLADAGALEF